MSGAHAAVHAQQEKKKREQEEEEMTRYTDNELAEDYEFKIVRSSTGSFKKREAVEQVIAEEAVAPASGQRGLCAPGERPVQRFQFAAWR